jgi:DNA polymerase I
MDLSELQAFDTVWGVDWEYPRSEGDPVWPVCCVARELRSGRVIPMWLADQAPPSCPYDTGPRSLYVGFSIMGDLGCHAALGWPMPHHVIDLFVEYRNISNGLVGLGHTGLVEVLQRYRLPHLAAAEKAAMIDLILAGGPWNAEDQAAILQYCASDTEALAHLLPAMFRQISLPQALQRGRYMKSAAEVERRGIPLDASLRSTLIEHWESIQNGLIAAINPTIGYSYDGLHLRMNAFKAWVQQQPFVWPRTPKRHDPKTDDETLKMLALLQRFPVTS